MISVTDRNFRVEDIPSLLGPILMDDFGGRFTREFESRVNGKKSPWTTRAVPGSKIRSENIFKKCIKLM